MRMKKPSVPDRVRWHRGLRSRGTRAVVVAVAVLGALFGLPGTSMASAFSDSEDAVLSYSPASSGAFVGSPTLEVLSDGTYLAASNRFGSGSSAFGAGGKRYTEVLRSSDKGTTWTRTAVVEPMFWATIFELKDVVYLIGNGSADEYDDIVISASHDGGLTWSQPSLLKSGTYTTGDTPVAFANGRVYKSFEAYLGGEWGNFRAMVISAPIGSDLTDPASWTFSNEGSTNLVLEGNMVVDRSGRVLDIQRWHDHPTQTMWEEVSADGKVLTELGPVTWPRGVSINKFYILWDEPSQRYLMVGNPETEDKFSGLAHHRNVLALYESPDLTDWKFVTDLVVDDKHDSWEESVRTTAFSQPTIQVDGDDLLVVSRTAYDGANSNHNTNQMTFHRFADFRTWLGRGDEVLHLGFDDPDDMGADVSASAGMQSSKFEGSSEADGAVGKAFVPAGAGMDLGNQVHPTLWGTSALSVAAWVRPATPIRSNGVVFQSPVNGTTTGVELSVRAAGDGHGAQMRAEVRATKSTPAVVRTVPYPDDGNWHHIAAVADLAGDTIRTYIDGVEVSPESAAASFGSAEYKVSNPTVHDRVGSATWGALFGGAIDEVRVFRSALDAGQIKQMAERNGPGLSSVSVNGVDVPFTSTADVQTLTVSSTASTLVFTPAAGSAVDQGRSTISLEPGETKVLTLKVSSDSSQRTLTFRVSRNPAPSSVTDVAGIYLNGAATVYPVPGVDDYDIKVGALPGRPSPSVSVSQVVTRSPKSVADIVSQPDMSASDPRAVIRVRAQDGTTRDITVHVDLVRDSLVGHWTFDEGECCTWKDSSVFGRTATGTGSPIEGVRTGAISLDGSARVVLGNDLDEALSGAPAITLTGWIKPSSLLASGENNVVFGTRINGQSAGMDVLFDGKNLRVAGRSTSSDGYQKATFPYPDDGKWHHIAATLDYQTRQIRLSIDGEAVDATNAVSPAWGATVYTPASPSNPSTLGGSPSSGLFFTGAMDDIRIYGKALSDEEISELAQADVPDAVALTSPVAPAASGWFTQTPTLAYRVGDVIGSGEVSVIQTIDKELPTVLPVTGSLTAPEKIPDGLHTITYRVSQGGRAGKTQTLVLKVDTVTPRVSAAVSSQGSGALVTLSGQDAASGVESLDYRVNGGKWTVYTGPVEITQVGDSTIEYRATDHAGNVSETGSTSVSLPPTTTPTPQPTESQTSSPSSPSVPSTSGGAGTSPSAGPVGSVNSSMSSAGASHLARTGASPAVPLLMAAGLLGIAALLLVRRRGA